jgi:WD40 repeat protein
MLAGSLSKIQQKEGNTTRKLVGHSGPVYSLSFDPLGGSAAPPRYLLSASADATTRLWSLDTMTNVVAFRGHQNPVWDVQWSPMGIYFATASRDRTARLWSTDRTSCLRIYAGHLSDVDVSDLAEDRFSMTNLMSAIASVSVFILIRYTLLRVQVIGLRGFGMLNVELAFAFSSAIRGASRHWLSVRMGDISPARAKTSQ